MKTLFALFGRPQFLRKFHGIMTWFWVAMAPVSMFTGLRKSIVYLVGISVYAIITGHWSSWQAARVETVQEEQILKQEREIENANE